MGVLWSLLRGIISLVLFVAAVTTIVLDMEFIGEKLGKYKLLRFLCVSEFSGRYEVLRGKEKAD